MCSGGINPLYIMSALVKGADGVLIGGCHYQTGNHRTLKRVNVVKKMLAYLGIDPRRVRLEWISASEAPRFAEVMTEFVKEIKELGPNTMNRRSNA